MPMKKFLSISVFAVGLNLSAQVFSTPVVMESPLTTGGSCGDFNSQCIVNGNPAIAYYDITHSNLMFVRSADINGASWNMPVTVDFENNVGYFCVLKIVDGYPAIAYTDITYNTLYFIRALDSNGVAWGNPVVVINAPTYGASSLSMEIVNGNPAIAYCDGGFLDAKYIRALDNHGNAWNTSQTLMTAGYVGQWIQLQIVNGNPAVTFGDAVNGTLYYVRANDILGASWGLPISIADSLDQAQSMSFAMVGGKPAVSYGNTPTNALKIVIAADANGTNWQPPQTLDIATADIAFTSMVNANGYLMLSYYSPTNNNTRFVRSLDTLGLTWSSPVQANASNEDGWFTSLTIVNGNPAISLGEQSSPQNLKYVRANDALGTTWGNQVVFNTPRTSGFRLSMAVVKGQPAVASSTSLSPNKLVYNRAIDSLGQSWNQSIELVNVQNTGCYTSMKVINGKPAIAFTGASPNRIRYIYANDSVGLVWGNPVNVDSTNSSSTCKLIDLNGIPAIAYWDNLNSTIRFTHATNQNGTSWAPATMPFPTSTILFDIDVVQGRPAVVFVDNTYRLQYCYGLDSLGTSWSAPIQISYVIGYDTRPSLEVIHGFPAAAFRDPNNYNVGYVRALNSLGTAWGPPFNTNLSDYTGDDPTLLYHDGRPVLSHIGINYERVYMEAIDSIGAGWNSTIFVDSVRAPAALTYSDAINFNGRVGIGYYQGSDRYGYFTSACVAPLPPLAITSYVSCSGSNTNIPAAGYGTLSWYTSSSGGSYLGSGSTFNTGILTNTTTYYVQDSTCAASTRTAVTVTVNPLPTISLSGTTQICSGDSTTLAVSGNGDGFEWSTGSLNMSESFVPASTTNYWVTTYDGNGCVDTIFFAVSVTQPQTTTQTIALCDGESYTVGSSSYNAAGTYTDSLSTLQLGCDSVVVTTITVQPAIDTTVIYSSGILSSNESGATYQWINCTTQQPVNGATNQNFTPTQNGTYAVAIVNGPCVDTSVCYTVTDVGVDEIVSNAAALVVTSVSGQISAVVQTGTGSVTYEFYNALGEIVFTTSGQVGEVVSYHAQVAGIYIVKAASAGTTMLQRVVVQ